MRRYRLRKEVVKLIISMLIVALGVAIYVGLGEISHLVAENSFYEFLTIIGWLWIIFFQNVILAIIWER